eukprot:101792-Pyramimonas_sp.AAC.1
MGPALQVETVAAEVKAVEALVEEWANKSLQTSNNTTQNHIVALKQAKGAYSLARFAFAWKERSLRLAHLKVHTLTRDCMRQLKDTEAQMSEKATLLEKRLAKENAEMKQLTETLEKVQDVEKTLPPQLEAMKENISSLQQKANMAKQGYTAVHHFGLVPITAPALLCIKCGER